MKSFLVYKFTCASCSSSYIGETCGHFKTRIEEHVKKDNKSHIFNHLYFTATCLGSYNSLCFKLIDKANSKFELKINEALRQYIALTNIWYNANISSSIFYCYNYTLLLLHLIITHLVSHLSLSSIVFIISTLIIGIFYWS